MRSSRRPSPLLLIGLCLMLIALIVLAGRVGSAERQELQTASPTTITVDPSRTIGAWEGWGSSLSWWARAIGGTANADFYADLIYTKKRTGSWPGLGLNIVRYNLGGGGIHQRRENKGFKLQWQMDIHGYWSDPQDSDPATWNWSADANQRAMMQKARERGANVFELFSDSPMWWMNTNRSTSGSDNGGNCLRSEDYDRFAHYLASVARYAADHWNIKFDAVEPLNEPSADWWKYPGRQEGCHFDVWTQQEIVRKLRSALDQARLRDMPITAADENNMDAGLSTWTRYAPAIRDLVGIMSVHGYGHGTDTYRGPNRSALRNAAGNKRLWLSEYGDGDASGYTMAKAIIRDLRDLRPNAWVYWQPVEPDGPAFGWGLMNAKYVDTHDRPSAEETPLIRVNRKFFVYGQFTRYLEPGSELIAVDNKNAIAAYSRNSHTAVVVKVTADIPEDIRIDLSGFARTGDTVQAIATTTAPGGETPDWEQHKEVLMVKRTGRQPFADAHLYARSVYTFVTDAWR